MKPSFTVADRYLPRSLIASLHADHNLKPARLSVASVERLAGGCTVFWLGKRATDQADLGERPKGR